MLQGANRGEGTTRYIRPSIKFAPSDDLSVTLIGEYNKFRGDGVVSKYAPLLEALDDHQVATDIDNKAEYEVKHLISDVSWDLGDGDLRVIAGWRETKVLGEVDGDGEANASRKIHSNEP